jgi:AcrR family transcriptional regulator
MSDALLERRRAAMAALQREHLVEGFVSAVEQKGYAATTVADIVRAAHVSKSALYEQFPDKEGLYLHLHGLVVQALAEALAAATEAAAAEPDWRVRVRRRVEAYLDCLISNPMYLTQMRIESTVATPAARQARHAAADRFTDALLAGQAALAQEFDDVAILSTPIIHAAIGGQTELVARTAEVGQDAVRALADPLTEYWVRLLRR